jgi:hypothetical protein
MSQQVNIGRLAFQTFNRQEKVLTFNLGKLDVLYGT